MSTPTMTRPAPAAPGGNRSHAVRILLIWAVLSAICTPIVYYVWGPHMPPGAMTDAARSQQWDNTVLATFATPVVLFVWTFFGYALVTFRQRGDVLEDGVPIIGSKKLAASWILTTGAIVMFAFIFGTYELIVPNGAGGGEGPTAIWHPNTKNALQVQVIAQQWRFSYRFPQFGGVETTSLDLPIGQQVQFNVTSLDVIHSFWSYKLGVKADANPGVNNIAFAKATQLGRFSVRCDELCGIWHGAMYNYGSVVSPSAFMSWITNEERTHAAVTKLLPPYALTYTPSTYGAGGDFYDNAPNKP